jgi:hypothetical protein
MTKKNCSTAPETTGTPAPACIARRMTNADTPSICTTSTANASLMTNLKHKSTMMKPDPPPTKEGFGVEGGSVKREPPRRRKNKMDSATEKQVQTLKKFARNQELNRGLLRGIEFENLNKKQASELITKCINQSSTFKGADELDDPKVIYAQNFRDNNGKFATTTLTDRELEGIREAHRQHCQQIMEECQDDYREETELVIPVFDKRCDKIFTWIQQALDEKVRKERLAQRTKFYPTDETDS